MLPNQVAVLYRIGAASRQVEAALAKHGIPHQLLSGLRFWDRKEVKDVVAWATVLIGRQDWESWRRASRSPSLKIGDAGWGKVQAYGSPEEGLASAHPQRSAQMMIAIKRARALGKGADALDALLTYSGFRQMLEEEYGTNEEELTQRLGNVHEAVAAMREFGDIEGFLDEVVLGIPERTEENRPCVQLATIHAAKGLEWDYVFIVALADEVLPHVLSLKEGEEAISEERRLLYVAATRARQGLNLSYPVFMDQPGAASKVVLPSRFIAEAGFKSKMESFR